MAIRSILRRFVFFFVDIWFILWLFSIFFPVLECCTTKNLATLVDVFFTFSRLLQNGNKGSFLDQLVEFTFLALLRKSRRLKRVRISDKSRVARFFLVQNTKTGKNIPNYHKLYQMSIKHNKRP
jgi:hypothetical protein